MLAKISENIKGWMLIAAFAGLAVFAFIINGQPFGTTALQSQYGIELLDLRFHYEISDIEKLVTELVGGAGVLYGNIVSMDLFFPIAYGLPLFLTIGFLLHRGKVHTPWFFLMLVPIGASLFDYAENFCTLSMLHSYQFFLDAGIYNLMHIFTKLKFIFTGLSLLLVFAAFIRMLLKQRK